MVLLSKVEHTFTIQGRGCVIVPIDITNAVHIGDAVQLRSPHGEVFDSRVVGIEMIKFLSGPCRVGILLSKEVAKEAAPPDTEIWLLSK